MTLLVYAGFLLAILVALVVGYQLGQAQALDSSGVESAAHRAIALELAKTQGQLTESQSAFDMLQMRYDVDRAGLDMVRSEITAHKEQILDLEERLQFFRGLMAPAGKAQGLSLRPLELLAMAQPGRYAYRIVVQQEARKHELVKGVLDVVVQGTLNGEKVSYTLGELSADIGVDELKLRFRYFQAVEGELGLPEGFEPEGVWVEARASEPRKLEAAAQFPWQLTERFTNAGK